MKKIALTLIAGILLSCPVFAAQEDIKLPKSTEVLEGEIIELEPQEALPQQDNILQDITVEKTKLQGFIDEHYYLDKGLVKIKINDKMRFDFGAIGVMDWKTNQDEEDWHSKYKFGSVDFVLSGELNEYLDYKAQVYADRNIEEETLFGDLWLRGRYKNYTAQIGRMRKSFGYEPTFSSYDLDFVSRSQISRLFGDNRDSGGKIIAKYKYADIATGLYASMQDQPFDFSHKGIEFNSWLTLKPLADFPELGDLKLAGGLAMGKRDYSYNNYGLFASYNYKKIGLKSEYLYKEASFYDEMEADGFYVDGTYSLTDKLQAALRFDSYNPDRHTQDRRSNEYTVGLNYFINNKNIMLALNYVFCDYDVDSHRVALQMRYKTW